MTDYINVNEIINENISKLENEKNTELAQLKDAKAQDIMVKNSEFDLFLSQAITKLQSDFENTKQGIYVQYQESLKFAEMKLNEDIKKAQEDTDAAKKNYIDSLLQESYRDITTKYDMAINKLKSMLM